jgi:hypothetical protein
MHDVIPYMIDSVQVRYGELISALYFNPWAMGTSAYGLPAVGLSHRPVYLTSSGPSGKTSLLRLLLARTKLRHARGVAALSGPQDDDENGDPAPGAGTADPPTLSMPVSRNGRSSTALSSHPVMLLPTGPIAAPVDPKFLPHLTTHWIAMPRLMSAAELQGSVAGKLEKRSPTLYTAPPRPVPVQPSTASTVTINPGVTSSVVELFSAKVKRVAGGTAAPDSSGPRVATLGALRKPGTPMHPPSVVPPSANRLLVVIDDISLHVPEPFGAHPPLELLRFWLEYGGFYDEAKLSFNAAAETQWILSGSATGGVAVRNALPDRLMRHVHLMCMPTPGPDLTSHIFRTLVSGYLSCDHAALALHAPAASHGAASFQADLRKSGDAAVAATMSLLSCVSQDVRPTPGRLQYALDSLRTVASVVDGICQVRYGPCSPHLYAAFYPLLKHACTLTVQIGPAQCDNPTTFARLWLHESLRVFHDRMGSVKHQLTVSHAAVDCVSRFFHLSMRHDAVMALADPEQPTTVATNEAGGRDRVNAGPVLFGRFTNHGALSALAPGNAQPYEELLDADAVTRGMYTSMAEHDMMHPSDKPMSDLVSRLCTVSVKRQWLRRYSRSHPAGRLLLCRCSLATPCNMSCALREY